MTVCPLLVLTYICLIFFPGDVNVDSMMDPSILGDLKWEVIKLARTWPFYFARIFIVSVRRNITFQFVDYRESAFCHVFLSVCEALGHPV